MTMKDSQRMKGKEINKQCNFREVKRSAGEASCAQQLVGGSINISQSFFPLFSSLCVALALLPSWV